MANNNRAMWDYAAARKGALVVTCAKTGELLSSPSATQEQLWSYVEKRTDRLINAAVEQGINLSNSDGRRWLKRAGKRADAKEERIKRETFQGKRWSGPVVWVSEQGKQEVRNRELFLRPTFTDGRAGDAPSVGSREKVNEAKAAARKALAEMLGLK